MFEMSMDADVIMAIMRFIPEVVWHASIRTTPLEKLYDTVLDPFSNNEFRWTSESGKSERRAM